MCVEGGGGATSCRKVARLTLSTSPVVTATEPSALAGRRSSPDKTTLTELLGARSRRLRGQEALIKDLDAASPRKPGSLHADVAAADGLEALARGPPGKSRIRSRAQACCGRGRGRATGPRTRDRAEVRRSRIRDSVSHRGCIRRRSLSQRTLLCSGERALQADTDAI